MWDVIGDALAEEGFALGGGLAMRAHGIVDRETQDIDAFRRDPVRTDPEAFNRAQKKLLRELGGQGLHVETSTRHDFARRFEVTDPATSDSTSIDLGRDRFPGAFVHIPGYGLVVNRDDMAGMKMRALWERHAERDYIDYDAMLSSGIWRVRDLVQLLDRTGSIDPPEDGDWRPKLAEILVDSEAGTNKKVLRGLGIDNPSELFGRLHGYADEHLDLPTQTRGNSTQASNRRRFPELFDDDGETEERSEQGPELG